ncbi:MAG: mechanosensitive ion channel [Alphaproteobacteria bacterium]|nr:mechanosensitive ion channel [Alphaproteobacteria bacterium]
MFKAPDITKIASQIFTWLGDHFWTVDFLYEAVLIIIALVLGWIVARLSKQPLQDTIDGLEVPIRVKRVLKNFGKLILPSAMLCFLFVGAMIVAAEPIAVDISFLRGLMKVLFAWILIRAAVQFIANNIVRNIFSVIIWGVVALSVFGILDETTTTLDAFGFSLGKFRISALAVIKGTLSLFILLYLASFVSTFAERRVLKSKSLTRSSQVLIAKIIRIALITFALIIGVTSAGIDLSVFTVFSGAVGLGVGFGLQKVVSNLFSGLLLLMDKSIEPGDVIELESSGTFGWVQHMGARYTEIITRDNKSYLIPNEEFITQNVVNWSHGDKLIRLHASFGVHYESDPHEVIRLAKEAATKPSRVVESPTPVCWIVEFGDSSINFDLRFWIKDAEGGVANVRGEVLLALWDAFKENDIKIPYPHREVFMHTVKDTPKPKKPKKPSVQDHEEQIEENPVEEKIEEFEKKKAQKEAAEKASKSSD